MVKKQRFLVTMTTKLVLHIMLNVSFMSNVHLFPESFSLIFILYSGFYMFMFVFNSDFLNVFIVNSVLLTSCVFIFFCFDF